MRQLHLTLAGLHVTVLGGFLYIHDELSRAAGDPRSLLAFLLLYGGLVITLSSFLLYARSK